MAYHYHRIDIVRANQTSNALALEAIDKAREHIQRSEEHVEKLMNLKYFDEDETMEDMDLEPIAEQELAISYPIHPVLADLMDRDVIDKVGISNITQPSLIDSMGMSNEETIEISEKESAEADEREIAQVFTALTPDEASSKTGMRKRRGTDVEGSESVVPSAAKKVRKCLFQDTQISQTPRSKMALRKGKSRRDK